MHAKVKYGMVRDIAFDNHTKFELDQIRRYREILGRFQLHDVAVALNEG